MAWGDEGVSKLQYKQDSVNAWGAIGQPKTVQITKAGIIKELRLLQGGGTIAFAGATTASAFGPYNAYTQFEILANAQQDILRASGTGLYYVNLVKRGLEKGLPPVNTTMGSPISVTQQGYVYDGSETAADANNTQWNWNLTAPIAQTIRSLGGDVGMIPMSTENSQLNLLFTPNALSVSNGTYTINNNSASDDLSQPYFGTNAVTVPNPTLDVIRTMYEPVMNPADFPDFSFVSQWLEETPGTFSGTGFTWKQNQDAGILCRLIFSLYTSTSPWGVLTSALPAANAIQLSYNTDTAKFKESGLEALARQRDQLGFDLPQGVFFYDMLGADLTLADVLNSYMVPAIQLQVQCNAVTLNSTVNPKVIAQRLLPIRVA